MDKRVKSDVKSRGHPSFLARIRRCTGYRPILDAAKTFCCDKAKCPGPSEASPGKELLTSF